MRVSRSDVEVKVKVNVKVNVKAKVKVKMMPRSRMIPATSSVIFTKCFADLSARVWEQNILA